MESASRARIPSVTFRQLTYLHDPIAQPKDDDVLHSQIPLHKHHSSRNANMPIMQIWLHAIQTLSDILFKMLQEKDFVAELGWRTRVSVVEPLELASGGV